MIRDYEYRKTRIRRRGKTSQKADSMSTGRSYDSVGERSSNNGRKVITRKIKGLKKSKAPEHSQKTVMVAKTGRGINKKIVGKFHRRNG